MAGSRPRPTRALCKVLRGLCARPLARGYVTPAGPSWTPPPANGSSRSRPQRPIARRRGVAAARGAQGAGPAAALHAAGRKTPRPAGGRGLGGAAGGGERAAGGRPAGGRRACTTRRRAAAPAFRLLTPERGALRRFLMLTDFPAWTVEKLVRAEQARREPRWGPASALPASSCRGSSSPEQILCKC